MSPSFEGTHPCSDRRLISLDAENSGAGTMHQDLAQACVATLAYAQQAGLASGGILPENKPKPGGKLSALPESGSVADRCNNGSGDDWPDPRNLDAVDSNNTGRPS